MPNNYDLTELQRHYLYLERLATGGVNSVVLPSLSETYRAVAAILGGYDSITNQSQLNAITRAIEFAIRDNDGWATLTQENLQELAEFEAQWQADFAAASTGATLATPTQDELLNSINNAQLILESGKRADVGLWADYTKANTDARVSQINNVVKRGFIRGETVGQMRRQIRDLSEGLLRREADALARTGYAHYASKANDVMIEKNKDVLEEFYYIVTFDNRLSDICRSVAVRYNPKGKRLKVDDKRAPEPPLHFKCRTRRIAVPAGFELDGKRAAVGGKKSEEAAEKFADRERRRRTASKVRYRGKRDSDIFKAAPIDASMGYESWLRSQPRWFVEDSLGKTKADLFLNKGLSLTKFSDMSARPLTVQEIIQRENITLDN